MTGLVEVSRAAQKQLRKVPGHVQDKFIAWVRAVELLGLDEVRKSPGFHDEPVRGGAGLRSIRLSRAYRAHYRVVPERSGALSIEFVRVEGVDKHRYGK